MLALAGNYGNDKPGSATASPRASSSRWAILLRSSTRCSAIPATALSPRESFATSPKAPMQSRGAGASSSLPTARRNRALSPGSVVCAARSTAASKTPGKRCGGCWATGSRESSVWRSRRWWRSASGSGRPPSLRAFTGADCRPSRDRCRWWLRGEPQDASRSSVPRRHPRALAVLELKSALEEGVAHDARAKRQGGSGHLIEAVRQKRALDERGVRALKEILLGDGQRRNTGGRGPARRVKKADMLRLARVVFDLLRAGAREQARKAGGVAMAQPAEVNEVAAARERLEVVRREVSRVYIGADTRGRRDADRAPRARSRAARGRAGRREDHARQGVRGHARLLGAAHPVHARSPARRHHRHLRALARATARSRCAPGPIFANVVLADEINRAPGQDAVGAARGDAGAAGDDRGRSLRAARSRSWCSPRRTRSISRAPIRCPRRRSIASSCACPWATRRTRKRWRCCAPTTSTRPSRGAVLQTARLMRAAVDHVAHPRRRRSLRLRGGAHGLHAHAPARRAGRVAARDARPGPGGQRRRRCSAGRPFVTPDDIRELAPSVFAHRLVLAPEVEGEPNARQAVISEAVARVGYRRAVRPV